MRRLIIPLITITLLLSGCSNNKSSESTTSIPESTTAVISEGADQEELQSDPLLQKEEKVKKKKTYGSLEKYVEHYAEYTFGDKCSVKSEDNKFNVSVKYDSDEYLDGLAGMVAPAFYSSIYYNIPEEYKDFSIVLKINVDKDNVYKSELSFDDVQKDSLKNASSEESYVTLLRDSSLYTYYKR